MLPHQIISDAAQATFEQFAQQVESHDWSDSWLAILPECYAGIDQNFDDTSGPDNRSWPPHAPFTVAKYGPHPLLVLSGKMRAAATGTGEGAIVRVTGNSLQLGISLESVIYAGAQNFGYRNIPQREYLGIKEPVADRIEDMLTNNVQSTLFG